MARQQPLTLHGAAKGAVRTQFAALCYRVRAGKIEVLLITSRRRKRWIVPKGWPMEGKTPAACAAREAWEEAGVRGQASDVSVGVYSYIKMGHNDRSDMPVLAVLYPIRVTSLKKRYPEARERRRMWVSRKKAAKLVESKALGKLIVSFTPPEGRGPA